MKLSRKFQHIALLFIIFTCLDSQAQMLLHVVTSDGDEAQFTVSDGLRIQASGANLIFAAPDQTHSLAIQDIQKLYYTPKQTSSIEDLEQNPVGLRFDGKQLFIENASKGETCLISSLSGTTFIEMPAGEGASLNLESLPSGVYIIKVGTRLTLKFAL